VEHDPAVATAWPPAADHIRRDGQLWRVTAADWQLRVRPRLTDSGAGRVRVMLSEQRAAVHDGRHWTHEATYWLYGETAVELRVTLPEGAGFGAAALDGEGLASLRPGAHTLRLPITEGRGLRRLRLRWAYPREREPFDQPLLARPRLEGAQDGPVLWTVQVPAGYHTVGTAGPPGAAQPCSSADQDLRRAEAQLAISTALAEKLQLRPDRHLTEELGAAQRRLYWYCRLAELALFTERASVGPVRRLRDRNLQTAKRQGFDSIRAAAEEQSRVTAGATGPPADHDVADVQGPSEDAGQPEGGMAVAWAGPSGAAPPSLRLAGTVPARGEWKVLASVLLIALCLGAWFVARLPAVLVWSRRCWPEQLVLAGAVGWFALEPGWPFLLVAGFGVLIRLGLLADAAFVLLRAALHRQEPGSAVGGARSG
jgi:hypothetical protein